MGKEISYLKGDATKPNADGNKIIAHICNDIGAWGKGFVMAISKRWPTPENEYKAGLNPKRVLHWVRYNLLMQNQLFG